MKRIYEEPKLIIDLFPGQDIVTFSGGGNNGGGEEEDPIPDFGGDS